MPDKEVKLSSPLDHVKEVKQALRDLWRAEELAEQAAVRIFAVFRELKFSEPQRPGSAIARLDHAHGALADANPSLRDSAHQLEMLLRAGGFTLPNK